MAKCKRCGLKTELNNNDIKNMITELENSGIALIDDETYKKRLKVCLNCDKLGYGTTCMLCGAVVYARCKMEKGRCPYPQLPKWR